MDLFKYLTGWFTHLLKRLGLLNKDARILLLGLDNAGKTTLLYKLKTGSVTSFVPTERANVEEIQVGKVKFKAFDLGGHERVRNMWRDFYLDANAIIWMVDCADTERFDESRKELHQVMSAEHLKDKPVVVLANKADVRWAAKRDEVIEALGISQLIDVPSHASDPTSRRMQCFRCSLVDGTGYKDAFEYLEAVIV
mmetsp:Transcript_23073/g.39646  ORF Transcript_23073/g.39646 Transcript_23073/m.39646 type:complete len:196 (+) Transcript_23073:29-616(+)|eukprot:CAMPEP_0196653386 /NCGR_PEP_ID=MMETSP1086-20130531/3013_1 /TAXON_ID=77921 /ORGANISM="Cyanoptyche  gloeocystis , Strain SAG4.97" /LENGTH=195 /DNA_ID=CAMNT_0041984559 /DNA_START=29 /DNA_END=616 /DNA_ORIENTATION=+